MRAVMLSAPFVDDDWPRCRATSDCASHRAFEDGASPAADTCLLHFM